MAQTQSPALKYQDEGDTIDYTPVSAVYGGDVVVVGTIGLVASVDIPAATKGSLMTEGVFKLPKVTGTFSAGDAVYWAATGNPNTGTAGTGAATSTASGNTLMGWATADAASGDDYVYTYLSAAKRTTTIAGSVTADDITGSDSSLGIGGQAAAQGGAIVVTGGTSSTSGNAGGAVSLVGGTPGATGIGGAVSMTGAIGGATSGAGGAASVTGGAGTAGNAAGGAASLIGGLGQGSAAGGAVTITSGAAGATGVAGVVSISVGAATAGNGSAMTLTGGNGAGGTASGGNINLIPGTAVSTGTPGEVQINSVSGFFDVQYNSPLMTTAVPASGTAQPIFMADRAYRVKAARFCVVTHGTSEAFQITKDTSGTAPGAGTALLTGAAATAVANTPVAGTLIATVASLTLAAGDRLSFLTSGTIGSAAGLSVSVLLEPC